MVKAEQIFKTLQTQTSYMISSTCEELGTALLMKDTFMFWAEVRIYTHSYPPSIKNTGYLHLSSMLLPIIFRSNTGKKGFPFSLLKAEVLLC